MMPDARRTAWTGAQWDMIQNHTAVVEGTLAFANARFNLSQAGEADLVDGIFASGGFFEVLGVKPVIGRSFSTEDDVSGGAGPDGPVAVIGHRFWQQRYGGATDVIGRTVKIDRAQFTIIGVAPPGFDGPEIGRTFDIAVPLRAEPLIRRGGSYFAEPGTWWLTILARLKSGQTIATRLSTSSPQTGSRPTGRGSLRGETSRIRISPPRRAWPS